MRQGREGATAKRSWSHSTLSRTMKLQLSFVIGSMSSVPSGRCTCTSAASVSESESSASAFAGIRLCRDTTGIVDARERPKMPAMVTCNMHIDNNRYCIDCVRISIYTIHVLAYDVLLTL